MKKNELEQLLEKICQEQIEPPEHLVVCIRQRLKRSRFLNVIIFISLFLNVLVTISPTAVVLLPGLAWTDKILWYFVSTTFFNGLIVLISLNREKVTAFFRQLTAAVNH